MKNRRGWLFWLLSIVGVLIVGVVGLFAWAYFSTEDFALDGAWPYDPKCGDDQACEVWRGFREQHPFPYQTVAAAPAKDGALVIILSEPAPHISKPKLEEMVRAVFADDLLGYADRRWMIGADGWLEDVVFTIKAPPGETPLDDANLRDRVAFLERQLFGTTFGATLEHADEPFVAARSTAADISPTPAELLLWTQGPDVRWTPVNGDAPAAPLSALLNGGAPGAYIDQSRQLVVFTLPRATLDAARTNEAAMRNLRAPFRVFSVSTDAVIGGVWNSAGGLALIGRSRRAPATALPPLRFETVAMLIREKSGELQQSYERTNLFAGKLLDGENKERDWAPILLSAPLIDSEFGALLNITDQFLKSWSEAGDIHYVYFDYPLRPAPGKFVFADQPLSDIVRKETGGRSVLFNWNTAGAAVTLHNQDQSVLAAGRTSALPVTYGSDTEQGQGMQTGDQVAGLRQHEEAAYKYFGDQRDPNLARVVSYTLIYQVMQAARTGPPAQDVDGVIAARAKAADMLVARAKTFLDDLDAGTLQPIPAFKKNVVSKEIEKARSALADYQLKHGVDNARLAQLLADPRRVQAELVKTSAQGSDQFEALRARENALKVRTNDYNARVKASEGKIRAWVEQNQASLPSSLSSLEEAEPYLPPDLASELRWIREENKALDAAEQQMTADVKPFEQLFAAQDALKESAILHQKLSNAVWMTQNLSEIRDAYIAANAAEPEGRIKTPSTVLSWNAFNFDSIGGHNLTARTLRIEIDPAATAMRLDQGADGASVLRVPPSQANSVGARAREIARSVEHEGRDLARVTEIVASAKAAPPRPVAAALGETKFDPAAMRCAMGCATPSRAAEPTLINALEETGNAVVAMQRNAEGYFLAARRNGQKITCCTRFEDTVSMQDYLGRAVREGDVLVLGESEPFIANLIDSVGAPDAAAAARAVYGGGGGIRKPPGPPGGGGGFDMFSGGGGQGKPIRIIGNSSERGSILKATLEVRDFKSVVISERQGADLRSVLADAQADAVSLKWTPAKDGDPFGVHLKFSDGLEADLIAGLDPARANARATVTEAVDIAVQDAATIQQFHNRVKALIEARSDRGGVKRLNTLVRDGAIRFRIARKTGVTAIQ